MNKKHLCKNSEFGDLDNLTPNTSSKMKYFVKDEEEKSNVDNNKGFKCTYDNCGKSFEYRWILERHMNSHFCFKLYKCDYENCSKAYKSKENLNLHVKNQHLGQKPYQCRFCTSRFSHRNGKKN